MPTIYAVASAKGGVGKTTTAANLAAALAAAGHTTVVVDGDIGAPNLAPALGVEVPEGGATLHDVLAGAADPVEATYEGPEGLAVVPGGRTLDAFGAADPSRLTEVVTAVTGAEYVVVDTGAGMTHGSVLPLSIADGVVLVSTPTDDALADARRTLELADRLGGTVAGLVLTRASEDDASGPSDDGTGPAAFDVPLLGRVPEDPVVPAAAAAGEPLSAFAPGSDAAAAYRAVASALTGDPATDGPDAPAADGSADANPAADGGGVAATPRSLDADATPAVTPVDAGGSGPDATADREDGADHRGAPDADDAPAPRSVDGDAEPAVTPVDDPAGVVESDPVDGDADAVDAPRTVLGEVVDGPVAGDDERSTDGGGADDGANGAADDGRAAAERGGFLGRLFR